MIRPGRSERAALTPSAGFCRVAAFMDELEIDGCFQDAAFLEDAGNYDHHQHHPIVIVDPITIVPALDVGMSMPPPSVST